MSHEIISVTFRIKTQKNKNPDNSSGRFSVPKDVCKLLGLSGGDKIHLIVQDMSRQLLFNGITELRSGTEVYGIKDIEHSQLIDVTASKPS